MDLELPIRDGSGRVYHAETYKDLSVSEFLREFIPSTQKPFVDERGNRIPWVLVVRSTGTVLDPGKTFRESGIHSGRELLLTAEAVTPPPPPPPPPVSRIELTIQDPKGRILPRRVSPDLSVRAFLHEVLVELGLPTDAKWEVDDKDIPRTLSLQHTLGQNGVLDRHHLFLRCVDGGLVIPWRKIGIGVGVVAAIALCAWGGYSWWAHHKHTPESVTVTISPSGEISLGEGKSQQFSAVVTGNSNNRVTWSIDPIGLGTVTPDGTYTAPAAVAKAETVKIIATSDADRSRAAQGLVSLIPHPPEPIVVHIVHPDTLRVPQGGHHQFSADVTGNNPAVNWSIDPPNLGSITQKGTYSAPATVVQTKSVTVVATSVADPNISDTFTFNVTTPSPPVLHPVISPQTASLRNNQTQQFTVTGVPAGPRSAIQWSLSRQVGHISDAGLYTAPDFIHQQQTITVIATMAANPHSQAMASLTLVHTECHGHMQPASFGVVNLRASQTHQFRVVGADDENAVEWSIYPVGAGEVHHGLYVAPGSIPNKQRIYVKARCGNTQDIEMFVNLVP